MTHSIIPGSSTNRIIRQNPLTSSLIFSTGSKNYLCRYDPFPAGSVAGIVFTGDIPHTRNRYSTHSGLRVFPRASIN